MRIDIGQRGFAALAVHPPRDVQHIARRTVRSADDALGLEAYAGELPCCCRSSARPLERRADGLAYVRWRVLQENGVIDDRRPVRQFTCQLRLDPCSCICLLDLHALQLGKSQRCVKTLQPRRLVGPDIGAEPQLVVTARRIEGILVARRA